MGSKDRELSSDSQHELLKEWYRTYRKPFMKQLGKQIQLPSEDLLDIFQESIIILYERVFLRSAEEPIEDYGAYLYGIGKHLAYRRLKKQHRKLEEHDIVDNEFSTIDTDVSEHMKTAIRSLGAPCKDILELFYYHRYAIESIRERLGYKSSTVVRVQKGRCIDQLRKKIKSDV